MGRHDRRRIIVFSLRRYMRFLIRFVSFRKREVPLDSRFWGTGTPARLKARLTHLRLLQERSAALKRESDDLKKIRTEVGDDLPALIARYLEYLQSHPSCELAHDTLHWTLHRSSNLDGGLEALQTAIRQREDAFLPRLYYYDMLRETGQAKEAVAGFRKMLRDPSGLRDLLEAHLLLFLGDALEAQGKRRAARSAWSEAARQDRSEDGYIRKKAQEALEARTEESVLFSYRNLPFAR